jgi:hypothetical protein
MNFSSKEEAKAYFLKQGMSEEEASKKAQDWEASNAQAEPTVAKSIAIDELKKSIQLAKDVEDITADIEAPELSNSLRKSVETMNNGEGVDLTDYFKNKQSIDIAVLEVSSALAQKQDLLAKSVQSLALGLIEMAKDNESFKKSFNLVGDSLKLNNQALVKSLQGQAGSTFVPSDLIKKTQFVENSPAFEETDLSKMNKSVVAEAFDALYKEGQVSRLDVLNYDGSRYIEPKHVELVKSKINSMKK